MPGTPGRSGGQNRVPTAIRVLRGNPGRRPLPKGEPTARLKVPPPPREFSDQAKREWRAIGRELLAARVVTVLDRAALAALVASWVRWLEVQESINETGLLVTGDDGIPRVNPLLRVSRDAQAEYTRMLTEFGMTPASRTRIHAIGTSDDEDDDPMEKLLRESGV